VCCKPGVERDPLTDARLASASAGATCILPAAGATAGPTRVLTRAGTGASGEAWDDRVPTPSPTVGVVIVPPTRSWRAKLTAARCCAALAALAIPATGGGAADAAASGFGISGPYRPVSRWSQVWSRSRERRRRAAQAGWRPLALSGSARPS
jgi:hypothetical protein